MDPNSNTEGRDASREGPITLVVLASQPVVRVGVRHLLEGQTSIVVIGDASRVGDAVSLVSAQRPDVMLLDPDCEDFSLQAITKLVGHGGRSLIVFTSATEPATHGQSVALGAMGVVEKRHSAATLVRAIEKVHAGEVWLERRATASLVQEMVRRHSNPEAPKISSLTKRELEVAVLVGSGLKSHAIAERLFISHATVRNHLTSILAKLELADRFELAFYAREHGLTGAKAERPHTNPPLQFRSVPVVPDMLAPGFERRRSDRRLSGTQI